MCEVYAACIQYLIVRSHHDTYHTQLLKLWRCVSQLGRQAGSGGLVAVLTHFEENEEQRSNINGRGDGDEGRRWGPLSNSPRERRRRNTSRRHSHMLRYVGTVQYYSSVLAIDLTRSLPSQVRRLRSPPMGGDLDSRYARCGVVTMMRELAGSSRSEVLHSKAHISPRW